MSFKRECLKVLVLCACLLQALACCGFAKPAAKRSVTIPRVENGPILRGDLHDPIWNKGVLLSNFSSLEKVKNPIQQTSARVMYDSKCLYLGISCREANMKGLIARVKGRDSSVWKDDVIEILIDTANAQHSFYHLFINPIGGFFGSRCTNGRGSSMEWTGNFKVKTARGKNGWTIELAIPFSSLEITPTEGLVWGVNVCRSRVAGPQEYSTWNPSPGGFEKPSCFGQFLFGDRNGKSNGIKLISWGDMGCDAAFATNNKISCQIPNNSRKSLAVTASLEQIKNEKKIQSIHSKILVKPGKIAAIGIPYSIAGSDGSVWSLKIQSGRTTLLKASRNVPTITEPKRVWKVENPLFKELLSKNPAGDQKYGAIYWLHTYDPYGLPAFAKEFGLRYSNEEAVKELADSKLLPLWQTSGFRDQFFTNMLDKYHAKILLYPNLAHWTAPDAPKSWNCSFVLDPRSKKVYMDDLKEGLAKWHPYIWGVYSGDELDNYVVHQLIEINSEHKNEYSYLRDVDQQIKTEFGGGKYGIPDSERDTNPYKWIALRKWVAKSLTDWQKEVYEIVKSQYPDIRVISMDPPGSHRPVSWDRQAPYFDIATQQLYPPTDPNRQQFGFITKLVADLTGKPTWTCTHVEHYAFSTTLDETRELMSEVMRSGGKGFHFWLKDEIGNNSDSGFMKATKWGFPDRWREICEINKLNGQMNEVAVPTDPDLAVFYSEDYYSAFVENGVPNDPEWAYTLLGPDAQIWFKFVNDNMVEDGTADLSHFKAVMIPGIKYERTSACDGLIKYVENGGTLIVGDPEGFTSDPTGQPLTEVRSKLIGSPISAGKDQDSMKFTADCSLPGLQNKVLSVTGKVFSLKAGNNTEILAKFPDGTPAVIRNKVGEGSVIVFASNPFTQSAIADPAWKSFFKVFCKDLGIKTDRNIWRFEFPPYKPDPKAEAKGTCLTGNYIKWWQDVPTYPNNAAIAGSYTYSLKPDAVPDRGEGIVLFKNGKLTDRRSAYTTSTAKLNPDNFVVTWKNTKPVDITFDLLKTHSFSKVNLWYSGQLPDIKVLGSLDGKIWKALAAYPKQSYIQPDGVNAREDVLDISIPIPTNAQVRYVKLSMGARDAGNPLTLAECEIWGN